MLILNDTVEMFSSEVLKNRDLIVTLVQLIIFKSYVISSHSITYWKIFNISVFKKKYMRFPCVR